MDTKPNVIQHNLSLGEEGTNTDSNVVLLVLDDAIETATEEFRIPDVQPEDIAPPIKKHDIALSFKWPLSALAVVGASAVGVVYAAMPVLYVYFPFYACLINFIGGIPSTKESLDSMADAIIPRLEAAELGVQSAASTARSKASSGYSSYTDFLRRKREETVQSIKGRMGSKATSGFEAASELESYEMSDESIRKNLDMTDFIGNDVNDSNVLVDAKESGYSSAPDSVLRGSRFVCLPLQSKDLFTFFITVPLLTVSFLLQLLSVWYFQQIMGFAPAKSTQDGELMIRKKWNPLILSIQTFALVAIQMLLALWASKASRVARIINSKVQNRVKDVSKYKKHLADCMIFIKKKLLNLIKFLTNISRIKDIGKGVVEQIGASMPETRWKRKQIEGRPNANELP